MRDTKGNGRRKKHGNHSENILPEGTDPFTFEYSATFGQIITNRTADLLNEYGKTIIFDYSYRYFYSDGYGKDFCGLQHRS